MTSNKPKAPKARTSIVLALSLSCLGMSTPALAQTTQALDRSAGSITELPLPQVADYWVSATRQPGGAIIFDGYAPDEKLRAELGSRPDADTQWLRLGRGAPEKYVEAMDFGMSVLDRLAEGRFALRDNVVTLNGITRTQEDFLAITETIADEMPSGLVLARAEILAPRAEPYEWRAQKSPDGNLLLSGMVPDPTTEKILLASAGPGATTQLQFASGHPDNFQASARTGIGFLQRLEEGQVSFDGTAWVLSGTASAQMVKAAIQSDFERQQLAASGWSLAVAAPAEAAKISSPVVNLEYAFSAAKAGDDSIIFSGQVPSESALRSLAAMSGGNIDAVSISEGAPADFAVHAEAGLRALMPLDEGTLTLSQGTWSLSGTSQDGPSRDAALKALVPSAAETWKTDISLIAQPAPVQPDASAPPAQLNIAGASDFTACEAPLEEFSARNAIRFRSGAALIAPESAPALDELAADLGACPDAPIHVEGHTDADGNEQLNLALSVARAEAVVNALIERGVAPERLYALGYGESSPIGDNATPEGKASNRRIVVKIGREQ